MAVHDENRSDRQTAKTSYMGLWIAGAALVLSAIWFYFQLQEWKTHGHDYVPMVVSIVSFLLMWAIVCAAAWKNWQDASRARSLRAQIVTIKDECATQINGLNRRHMESMSAAMLRLTEDCHQQIDRDKASWRLAASVKFGAMVRDIPKATELQLIAAELDDLRRRLEDMIAAARTEGPLPNELEHPLSGITDKLGTGCAGFPIEIWRFQQDFKRSNCRLRARAQAFLARNLESEFGTTVIALPDDRSGSLVLKLLSTCSEELLGEASRLLLICQPDSSQAA